MRKTRMHNFNGGPAAIPRPVLERAREELRVAEAELARVEQMKQGRETADKTSTQRRNERAAGLARRR